MSKVDEFFEFVVYLGHFQYSKFIDSTQPHFVEARTSSHVSQNSVDFITVIVVFS